MPGGGITLEHVEAFIESGFNSIHCSASEKVQTLSEPPSVPMQNPSVEGMISTSSFIKIQEILKKLTNF